MVVVALRSRRVRAGTVLGGPDPASPLYTLLSPIVWG